MTSTQSQTILELRRRGLTYADIAAHIGGSANTVKSHCLRNEPTLRAWAAKEICKHCGIPLAHLSKAKRKSFCSDRCRRAWWKAHPDLMRPRPANHFTCLRCGRPFESYESVQRKYCSRQCYHLKGESS